VASATTSIGAPSGGTLDLALGRDFVASPELSKGEFDVEAPLAFVGYAVKSTEHRYDDLDAMDVKGKVAVVFIGAPRGRRRDFFPDLESSVASDRGTKIDDLADRGARGVIFVRTPRSEKSTGWDKVVQWMQFESMARVAGNGLSQGNRLPASRRRAQQPRGRGHRRGEGARPGAIARCAPRGDALTRSDH